MSDTELQRPGPNATKPEVQAYAEARGLDSSGTVAEITARIAEADEQAAAAAEEEEADDAAAEQAGEICPLCFPGGWAIPDQAGGLHDTATCLHGQWTR
jgi:hypothetical protein